MNASDFRFWLARYAGQTLKLDCGHEIAITAKGLSDTVIIWQVGTKIRLVCHNCGY